MDRLGSTVVCQRLPALGLRRPVSGFSGRASARTRPANPGQQRQGGLPAQLMPRHVVARAADLPPGTRKLVSIAGRDIVILNIKGELFALSDKCPHKGGSLSRGKLTGLVVSREPGRYQYSRAGDVRSGRSWCDPNRLRLLNYAVSVEPGAKLVAGPYVAETFQVAVEDAYIVVETK